MIDAGFNDAYPLARRAAQVHAAAAVTSAALADEDRRDLEQEGLLAFWRSLPYFEPSKASIRTFAERVVANKIQSESRARRANRRTPVSMKVPSYSEHLGASVELRIDVERVVAGLADAERRLALLLADYSPAEASRILRKSRSTVYERIRRIRVAFSVAGLAPSSARCRIPKSQIEARADEVITECCRSNSGGRDTSERMVATTAQSEQIETCLTVHQEVA
jgi:RNA polymerase sigma-70 factor (ECF subfamily)